MKTTITKLTLASLLALLGFGLVSFHVRGDLWIGIAPAGDNAVLTWSNSSAALEHSLAVTGDWSTVEGALSPHTVPVTNEASFYRLRLPTSGPFDFRYLAPTFTTGLGDPAGCGCTSPENPNSLSTGGSAQDNGQGSVFLHTGELTQHAVDLAIPGRGMDWKFERRYRSGMSYDGPLGHGWEFNHNRRLAVQPNGDALRADGLGRVDRYIIHDGVFTGGKVGLFSLLTRNGDGTFEEQDPHGTVYSYAPTNTLGIAKLTRIRDRNGNEMNFYHNANGQLTKVVDTLGRSIAYSYDGNGRLTHVTDFTGRTLWFSYDGDGHLTGVTSPSVTGTPNGNDFPLGKTTRYSYSSGYGDARLNHNLLSVTAPNEVAVSGPPRLAAQYDTNPASTNVDRVVSLTLGGTNASGVGAGGTLNFRYVPLGNAPSNDFHTAVSQTTVTNRNGHVADYLFNATFNVVQMVRFTELLRPSDPIGFTNEFEYNPDGLITRQVFPEGNSTEYTYDSANPDRLQQGNLLQVRRLPGPRGGDQAQLVTSYTYEPNFNFVTSSADARGNTTTHTYDERGNRTNTQHRIPGITEDWEYNAFGQVTAHVLPDNGSGHRRRDTSSYYASGPQTGYLQARVVDSGGFSLTTSYEYDAVGNRVRVVDPRGNDTLYTVNALNQVVRERSRAVDTTNGPVRYQRDFSYDANDNLVRTDVENRDDNGLLDLINPTFTTTYAYDILNYLRLRMEEEELAHEIVTQYSYDANQNRILVRFGEATAGRDPFNTEQTLYDERDRVFRVIRGPGSPDQSTTQTDYDGNANRVRVTEGVEDSGGHATTYTYDGYDRRVIVTDPMGNVTTERYDANGNLTTNRVDGELTDLPGSAGNTNLAERAYTYDAMDRRIRSDAAFFDTQTQLPIGDGFSTTVTIYSDASQVLATVDDNNHGTTNRYDTANRLAEVSDARGNTATHTYDANGNRSTTVETEKSDLGNPDVTVTTGYTYDGLDRRIEVIDNLDQTNRHAYDSRNNRVTDTDARGNVTRYTYDGLDRRITTERLMTSTGDGNGVVIGSIVTRQTWDDSGRPASHTDGNNNTTTYAYDSLDRRIRTVLPDGTSQTNVFDAHGNRTQTRDANGSVVTSGYDANDRLTNNAVTRGAGVLGTTSEVYQYDGLSRLVVAQNNDSVVTRSYDSLGAVTRETQQVLPGGPVRTVSAVRDGAGNLTRLTYPGGTNIVFDYNSLDLPSLIRDDPPGPMPFIASYQYVGRRVEQRTFGNETVRNVEYDALRRISRIEDTNTLTGATIENRMLAWDAASNKMMDAGQAGPTIPDSRQYHYDSANRLDGSQHIGPIPQFAQYQLDNAGNRRNVGGGVDAGPYTLSPVLPEPADFQVNQYTTTPFDSRTYDRNGNLRSSGIGNFRCNYRNEFVQATGPGLTATYKYDCLGRRIEKNVNAVITRHYYFGGREIEEQDATHATVATYVSRGDPVDNDDAEIVFCALVQMTRGGQRYYYHTDDLGSPRKVTDAAGNLVEQYDYHDYGKPLFFDALGSPITATAIGNAYLFEGMRYDSESGFYRCSPILGVNYSGELADPSELVGRSAVFDPRAGRFLQRAAKPGGPANPYTFAQDNPFSPSPFTVLSDPVIGGSWLCTGAQDDPCKDPCGDAKKQGLDKGSAGGVVCCNGKKYSCAWIPGGGVTTTEPAQGIIRNCIVAHEDGHHAHVDCPKDDGKTVSRPPWKDGQDPKAGEHAGYTAEKDCLDKSKKDCGKDAACKRDVQARADFVQTQINANSP